MGTRMAPQYANIFMTWFEKRMLKEWGNDAEIRLWKRFIDDIFMIWRGTRERLNRFIDYINDYDEEGKIQFTAEISDTQVPFLDVLVQKTIDSTRLQTDLYTKPTDRKIYLHFNSDHPLKQKKNLPYGLLIRVRRICSTVDKYDVHAREILATLKSRGYPQDNLEEANRKVRNMDRNDLLKPKQRRKSDKIRLITHYNKRNPPMNELIQAHSHLLERTRKPAIKQEQLQVTYSRGPNLGDILTHTQLEKVPKSYGCKPCNKPCATCRHVCTSKTVTSSKTKKKYNIQGEYTCQSTGAIYVLTCKHPNCNVQYVGESSRTVNERFRNHTHDIRYHKDTPVANHMNSHENNMNFNIHIVSSTSADQNNRRRLEEAWITLMDTMKPRGLNARW